MKLQAIVVGSGAEGDPFTVPLPTWVLVDIDYQGKVAIIDVPDHVYAGDKGFETKKVKDSKGNEHEILVPTRDTIAVWEEIEAEKYPRWARDRRLRDVVRGVR
jgi:dUTPase